MFRNSTLSMWRLRCPLPDDWTIGNLIEIIILLRVPDTSRSSSEVEAEAEAEQAEEPQQVVAAHNTRALASRDDMSYRSHGFGRGSAGSVHSRVVPVGHCSNMLDNGVQVLRAAELALDGVVVQGRSLVGDRDMGTDMGRDMGLSLIHI